MLIWCSEIFFNSAIRSSMEETNSAELLLGSDCGTNDAAKIFKKNDAVKSAKTDDASEAVKFTEIYDPDKSAKASDTDNFVETSGADRSAKTNDEVKTAGTYVAVNQATNIVVSAETVETVSSAELLEGALRQGEQSFFPKLSEDVRVLVDIINHERTQAYIRSKFDNFNRTTRPDIDKLYNDIENATSVFDMFKSLKKLLDVLTNCVHPSSMFSQIYNGLLSGIFDDLDFLQKSLSESERVDMFIRYIEGVSKPVSKRERDAAFEEYLRQWRQNNQPSFRTTKGFSRDLNKEIEVMRREYEEAMEGTEYVKVITIRNIEQYFEPLREKLLSAREEHYGATLATVDYVGSGISCVHAKFSDNASRFEFSTDAKRVREKGWYNRISKYLIRYLTDPDSTDAGLIPFIREEDLEKDIHHFRDCIRPWLKEARSALENLPRKSFYLPKELIMKEMKRVSKFFYALILNDPAMLREHQELLDELIQDATKISTGHLAPNVSLMPLISFGQLPLAGGSKDRIVGLKLVLASSVSHERIRDILQEITAICKNVRKSEIVLGPNEVRVINLEIRIEDNVPRYIGGLISRLSDLHIRAVLVGEYGMGIGEGQPSSGSSVLRHAMNPQFNRIYSVNAEDKAENFMPTYYRGSLDRGGEPYFCPNGWRRYSIDVGMSASEFERKYGDWPVAYHGTKGHLANKILMTGMKASGESLEVRCPNLPEGGGAIFLSPSIEYSGHPYYANVWKVKNKYVQMVLQVRVDRKRVFNKIEGTLDGAFARDPPLDPNFEDNSEMEWIVKWPPFTQMTVMDGLLVYGIMLRVTDEHPGRLPQNKWWEKGRPGVWNFF